MRPSTGGFALIEVVVTMTIIGILTAILAVAFPVARQQQALQLAQQRIEALLREAQLQTLNEERAQDCRALFTGTDALSQARQRRCSDVGLYLQGRQVRLFADTDGDKIYATTDFQIRPPEELPAEVVGTTSLVFNAAPPHLELYGNGLLIDDQHPLSLTLHLSRADAALLVRPFGKVEQP